MYQPCWTNYPVAYCAKQMLAQLDPTVDPSIINACTTPVMPCVQQAVSGAFAEVDRAVILARATAQTVIDKVSQPPDFNAVCYAIWGQPCSSDMITG